MHRQVASLLSAGGSPGKLARLGNALGAKGIDIATTGGAEWLHHGPVTLIIKDDWGAGADNEIRGFAQVMADEEFPWLVFRTVEVELKDEAGSLGKAATALDDINIYTVTVLESKDGTALVGLGVRPSQVGEAIRRLRAAKYKVSRRHHPKDKGDDQASWWDAWDERTERLLRWFDENPNASPSDPKFYELSDD